jgi:hypothetical protein
MLGETSLSSADEFRRWYLRRPSRLKSTIPTLSLFYPRETVSDSFNVSLRIVIVVLVLLSIDDFCNSQANTEHHSMARLPTSSFAS